MPFKSTLAASAAAAAAAIALIPAVAAAPSALSPRRANCKILGKGALGFNSTSIPIYSNAPPAYYLTIDANNDNQIAVSKTPTYENQTMFEFIQCQYTPDQYPEGKGAISTYQGHIRGPDGQCVSVQHIKSPNSYVKMEPCDFSGDAAHGGVKAAQHFQFQLDTFTYFYSAVFLGKKAGPQEHETFGAGGHSHWSLQTEYQSRPNDKWLFNSFQPSNAQTGDRAHQLIGQLGDQYKPTTKPAPTSPACKLVKSGNMELVNTKTGATQSVTTDFPSNFPYAKSPLINANGNPTFNFYQCSSDYMGYTSTDGDYYGHFQSAAYNGTACFSRQIPTDNGNVNNYILESTYQCLTGDGKAQLPNFFRLKKDARGYEVHYLGSTKSENKPEFGWTLAAGNGSQPVIVNPSGMTDYQLLFTPN
ncbi:hypothetical protein PSEUBRA_003419 [Kalmanozyma brasiliensis GHG001]|uniref:Uncharacterized protein n=1 Tax=Kalmanozyma brasiliensis (strain GHG001) TaxID=1365824 RepID=V5EQ40_KALBG|nr:uncharacterized protein PSEUBRA_003419 [Kalmanozyma brasiliensis GHG001]EST07245.1 hypothetical protein PSEUBRA_003419 [Kalmanozyma brasiliensis GHG001]